MVLRPLLFVPIGLSSGETYPHSVFLCFSSAFGIADTIPKDAPWKYDKLLIS